MPRWCWRSRVCSRAGAYHDVSLQVRAGEVLGIYGFLGSGQLELARTLFGMLPAERGRIVAGRPARCGCPPRRARGATGWLSCRKAGG